MRIIAVIKSKSAIETEKAVSYTSFSRARLKTIKAKHVISKKQQSTNYKFE
jgi:hypothetical protein